MPLRMNVFYFLASFYNGYFGRSILSWMTSGSKAFPERFVLHFKSDPIVEEMEIIHVNPNYAQMRCSNGREVTVLFKNLAPCPQEDTVGEKPGCPLNPVNDEELSSHDYDFLIKRDEVALQSVEDRNPANNAMQGPCGPFKGCPYGIRIDLATGAAVAPHGFTARVSCGSNYLCKKFLFKNN